MHKFPKKKVLWLKMDETYDKITFLLKYAPKYYTKIELEASEVMRYPIQSKIKRIKVIKQVYATECTKAESGVILNILKTKNKQIKIFEGVKSYILQNFPFLESFTLKIQELASWRIFLRSLHLGSLEVESSKLLYFHKERQIPCMIRNYLKWRFWTHLAKLPVINKFHLHVNNFIDDSLLDFLQRLSTLQMRLETAKSCVFAFNYVENLVESNADFSKIFPHVTVLKTLELSYQNLEKLLKSLPYCSNIKKLDVLKVMPEDNEGGNNEIYFSNLRNLVDLNNLQMLYLSINLKSSGETLGFFQNFCLPLSTTNITLDLHEINWNALITTAKICSSEIFQANKICAEFYQKWKNLKNLLALNFSLIEEETSHPSFGFFFILPVLQNVQTLLSFYYSNSCEPLSNEEDYTDFNLLWQSLQHLCPNLKTLYLETSGISLKNFSLENNGQNSQAALTKLGLCGNVFGDKKLQNLYDLFMETSMKNGEFQSCHLEIGCVVIRDVSYFEQFLEGIIQCPRHIKLSMDIDVETVTTGDFISTINKYIARMHCRNLNKIHFNLKSLQPKDLKELKHTFLEYKLLEQIQVSDKRGRRLHDPNDLDLFNYSPSDHSDDDDSFFSLAEIEDDDDNDSSNDEDI